MANKRREKVVEDYLKAYEDYKANNGKKAWRRCQEDAKIGTEYPLLNLDDIWQKEIIRDKTISDLVGFVNRCTNKDPVFLEYCKRIAIREFSLVSPNEDDTQLRIDINEMSDYDLIEQLKARGIYYSSDGKWKKKIIVHEEREIDIV